MIATRKISEASPDAPPPVIALLRLVALECRTAPRHAVEACAILDPNAQVEDYLVALVHALPGATDRRMIFWGPGVAGLSFDERWIIAACRAAHARHAASVRFLLARRIRRGAIPTVRLLIAGLADAMDDRAF